MGSSNGSGPPGRRGPQAARGFRSTRGVAVLAAGVALGVVRREDRPPALASAQAARPVRFQLEAPASSHVAVVGDFNDWDPRASPMVRAGGQGTWSLRLALPPGRYRYTFLVDGTRWVSDPSEPPALGDDFDTPTSVITVAGGSL